jgi:hypothetical protein
MPSVEGNKVTNGDQCAKLALVVDVARAVWGSTLGEEATAESVVGTTRTSGDVRLESEKRSKADIAQAGPQPRCSLRCGGAFMMRPTTIAIRPMCGSQTCA